MNSKTRERLDVRPDALAALGPEGPELAAFVFRGSRGGDLGFLFSEQAEQHLAA
jgi:hypothetical protein